MVVCPTGSPIPAQENLRAFTSLTKTPLFWMANLAGQNLERFMVVPSN